MSIKESEYIIVTNRVKISTALNILRDVLPGDDYGINDKSLDGMIKKLRACEVKLYSMFRTIEG